MPFQKKEQACLFAIFCLTLRHITTNLILELLALSVAPD
uniref:Uncharacterized protein n=1 Tax=Anguilla anguilla TaxID=7936 RepID=A0A0E9Q5Z1_ANGAN